MPLATLNFSTFLDRIAVTDSQEVKWDVNITLGMRGRANPFYDLIGGIGDMRPIMEVADFNKIKGQEIVFTVDRPLGGPGVQGSGTLIGNEEKETHGTYRVKVGQMRKAVATDALTLAQTVIGSKWDVRARAKLKEWFARQLADEIMMEMKKRKHGRNTLFPNGKTTRDQLTKNDFLSLSTIGRITETLSANQASPFSVTKGKSGMEILKYMVMGPQYAFRNMKDTSSYQNLLALAGDRGGKNWLFGGGLPDWDNTLLHSWNVEDHKAVGPIGAPCVPRAYLGIAITADDEVQDITGGGNATNGALTTPLYFQHFSNAAFTGHEGEKIAAVTNVDRYVAIKNITGADAGKIGIYQYRVNNGNKLVMLKRLRAAGETTGNNISYTTVGEVVWDTGAWPAAGSGNFAGLTDAHPAGSIIYECNAKGQPFVATYGLAKDMMITGWGSIEGEGAQKHGMRLVEKQDYAEHLGIGWKQVWGCRAAEDADNMPFGFVYVESAYTPDGWPEINS